jgi:hypothetical protein
MPLADFRLRVFLSLLVLGHAIRTDKAPIVIQLTNSYNSQYYGAISLGTPQQRFNVQFSTATVTSWVPSAECQSNFCFFHNEFNEAASSTATVYNMPFVDLDILHGGRCVDGFIASDTLTLNSASVNKFVFGLAEKVSGYVMNQVYDGTIGLGLTLEFIENEPTIVEAMQMAGYISQSVFSIYYTNNNNPGSVLIIGGLNQSLFSGSLTTHTVMDDTTYWQLPVSSLLIGSRSVPNSDLTAIIDSSQTGLVFPTGLYNSVYSQTRVSTNCSNLAALPSITFVIEGVNYVVPPTNYVLVAQSGGSKACNTAIYQNNSLEDLDTVLLGDAFLKTYFSYFDISRRQVSFAKAA